MTPFSRRRFLKNSAYVASAFASGTALSACGLFDNPQPNPTDEATNPPTQDSKTLYIYGWATYVDNLEIQQDFTKETGIKIVGDSYESNEVMLAKLQASGGRSGYSIIYPSDYMVSQMSAMGLLTKLDKSKLPNLQNIGDLFLKAPYDLNSVYSIPVSLGTTGIAYNIKAVTAAVGAEPTDWSFFWEHKDKLRMTLLNDPREVLGMALHTLGQSYNATTEEQVKQAFERLQELKPAIAKFETDAWREPLIAGDYTVCMAFSGDGISVARQNAGIKYILPSSGTSIWTDTITIPTGAPNPEAAYAWINYILRPDVAAKLSNSNSFGTTNKAAKSQIAEDLKAIAAWEPTEAYIAKSDRITKLDPAILQVYEKYWTRLTSI